MIEVNNLEFAYPKASENTIKNISFSVEKGEIFGFLGPSGAGKSTTQKILIRLLKSYTGNVVLAGKNLENWNSDFYNHIGIGFELPNHYSKLSALENLSFFASFYNKKMIPPMHLLEMVGLANDANKKTQEFSKGMKMRLNFIRSLMHDPEILFLDEPTSGLDPTNARKIKDIILDERSRGKTIFLTTHNMNDAEELCDRVSFIAEGEICVTDSPHNLKLMNGQRILSVEHGDLHTKVEEFSLDNLGENRRFQQIIRENKLISMHSKEAGLDDIFIKLTGKTLN